MSLLEDALAGVDNVIPIWTAKIGVRIPASQTIGFDRLHDAVRADCARLLAELDADLEALNLPSDIPTVDPTPTTENNR